MSSVLLFIWTTLFMTLERLVAYLVALLYFLNNVRFLAFQVIIGVWIFLCVGAWLNILNIIFSGLVANRLSIIALF